MIADIDAGLRVMPVALVPGRRGRTREARQLDYLRGIA